MSNNKQSNNITPWLKPCDIILVTTNDILNRGISLATNSDYSHAMVYLGNNQIIEATGAGTQIKSINKALSDATKYQILRVNDLTDKQCNAVVNGAKYFTGENYNYFGAAKSTDTWACKLPSIPGEYFCSELVVELFFKTANVTLTDKKASCITPGDISSFPTLKPVIIKDTNEVFEKEYIKEEINKFGLLLKNMSNTTPTNTDFNTLKKDILEAIDKNQTINQQQFDEFESHFNSALGNLQKDAQQQQELSQTIGRQEAQLAKVKQNVATMQNVAAIGTFLLGKLFPDNPKVAKTFGTVAGAGIGVYATIAIGMASAVPPVAIVLGCIAAILPIFNLFGDDSERDDQILQELRNISEKIDNLHRNMYELVDGLHKHLGYVHENLSGQISGVSLQITHSTFAISNQLGIVADNLRGLVNNFKNHEQATQWRLDSVIKQLHHISEQTNLVPIQVTEIISFFDAINGLNRGVNNKAGNNAGNISDYFNKLFTHATNSSVDLYTSQQLKDIEQYKSRFNTYKGRYLFKNLEEVAEDAYIHVTWKTANPLDINYNWSLSKVLGSDSGLPNFIEMSKAINLMVYYNFYYNIDLSEDFKTLTTFAESHRQRLLKMSQPSFIKKDIKEDYLKATQELLSAIYSTLSQIVGRELDNISTLPTTYHLSYLNHHIPAIDLQVPNTQIDQANSLIAKVKQKQSLSADEENELAYLLQFFVQNYSNHIEESYYWRDIKNAIANKKTEHIYTVKEGDTLTSIAKEKYGNGNKHTLISKSNSNIKNPDVIHPGQVLCIPPISHENNIALSATLDEQLNFYLKDDILKIIKEITKKTPDYITLKTQSNQVFRETITSNTCFYYTNNWHNTFAIAQMFNIINVKIANKETDSRALADKGIVQKTADKGDMVINQGNFAKRKIEVLISTEMYDLDEQETAQSDVPVLKGFHNVTHLKNWQQQLGLTNKNYDLSDIKAIVEHINENNIDSSVRSINSVGDLNLITFLYNELHQLKYKPLKQGLATMLKDTAQNNEELKKAINNFEKCGLALLFYSTVNRLVTSQNELTPVDYLINYAHEIYTFEDVVNYVNLYAQTNYMDSSIPLSFWHTLSEDTNPTNKKLKLNKDSLIDVIYHRLKTHIEETADETVARLVQPKADDCLPILRDIILLLKQQQQ